MSQTAPAQPTFEQFVSFDNLWLAWRKARKGKRRESLAVFALNLEEELISLQTDLINGTYTSGPYHSFIIKDRKQRTITAAPVRDRIVHHALINVCLPVFEYCFHPASRACRPGKGTHAAVSDYQRYARRMPYVLKMDISRYFASISRERLLEKLTDYIIDERLLQVFADIILQAPGDEGLPLGNLTSQVLGNMYLDDMDWKITGRWRAGNYLRYVDDLIVLSDEKEKLWRIHEQVVQMLADDGLLLHPRKVFLQPTRLPLHVLGFLVTPRGRRLRPDNGHRFARKLRRAGQLCRERKRTPAEFRDSINAWIGHARHGNTRALRAVMFNSVQFGAGSPSRSVARRFLEQSTRESACREP